MDHAQSLFHKGKKLANKLPSYHDAFNREFYTNTKPRSEHVNTIRLSGDMNNNKMERFNGEVRDKVMRGLKKKDTPILAGYQIFHNYVRPHMGLNGMTPAEKSGIIFKGNDKWKTRIENSCLDRVK